MALTSRPLCGPELIEPVWRRARWLLSDRQPAHSREPRRPDRQGFSRLRLAEKAGDCRRRKLRQSVSPRPSRARRRNRVILAGHIDDQEVIRELHCNCFAYVHGHSVGGTNPSLLKAMGYGNCILALDTVFNREVLADGGIFFPRDAAVLDGRNAGARGESGSRRGAPQDGTGANTEELHVGKNRRSIRRALPGSRCAVSRG